MSQIIVLNNLFICLHAKKNCHFRKSAQIYISSFCICRDVTFDKDITPYIHVFIYHSHFFAKKYGSLKVFEMEAVEQLNYVNKLVFFGASNHGKDDYTVTEQVHKMYLIL